jgi:predicted transcriptional regulator
MNFGLKGEIWTLQNEALQHKTRRRIYDHIANNPGVSFKMLASLFDLNEGTLRYHLEYLRKYDLINRKKVGNKRCYTCKELDLDRAGRELVNAINRDQKKILSLIKEVPGSTRTEIIERSRLSRRQVTRALSKLKEKGLVLTKKEEGVICYEMADNGRIFNEMMVVLMEKYLRGEISLYELKDVKRKLEDIL